jgi:hypothetical protein
MPRGAWSAARWGGQRARMGTPPGVVLASPFYFVKTIGGGPKAGSRAHSRYSGPPGEGNYFPRRVARRFYGCGTHRRTVGGGVGNAQLPHDPVN